MFDSPYDFFALLIAIVALIFARKAINQAAMLRARLDAMEAAWEARLARPPLTPPLPLVLGALALILAIPWWADRRRRARARVLPALAAWPEMARAIGLPGSAIQSVSVDLWGWRAWLRLAYGQTIADVTARIPAIESALGTVHGAVRVFPAWDGKANWCEIRVLGSDTPRTTSRRCG